MLFLGEIGQNIRLIPPYLGFAPRLEIVNLPEHPKQFSNSLIYCFNFCYTQIPAKFHQNGHSENEHAVKSSPTTKCRQKQKRRSILLSLCTSQDKNIYSNVHGKTEKNANNIITLNTKLKT